MDICFDYLQGSGVLKCFATKITTSSVKERQKILLDLLPCIRKKGWLDHLVVVATWHVIFANQRVVNNTPYIFYQCMGMD